MAPGIRWGKVAMVALALLGLLSAISAAPLVTAWLRGFRKTQLHPHPASDDEQRDILRGVLDSPRPFPFSAFGAGSSVVLFDSTLHTCHEASTGNSPTIGCISGRDREDKSVFAQGHEIPGKLLEELFAVNQTSSKLPAPRSAGILLRPHAQMDRLYLSANRLDRFHSQFPGSRYAIEATRAVLSEDGARALILVRFVFLPGDDQSVIYYLVHSGDTWHVESADAPTIIR
ncbi:MAG: hypothetical protein JSS03_07495 [Proteobacteria bacterium]|nr:hypothetical protein [Pseudomonadota bacterium]